MPDRSAAPDYPASLLAVTEARAAKILAHEAYVDAVVAAWRDRRSFTSIALAADVTEASIRMLLTRRGYRKATPRAKDLR